MTKSEFVARFYAALAEAETGAAERLGEPINGKRVIRLHGYGLERDDLTSEEAADVLWLGGRVFHRMIDVAVTGRTSTLVEFFVRPSGHPPTAWAETWDPNGAGPFKQVISEIWWAK